MGELKNKLKSLTGRRSTDKYEQQKIILNAKKNLLASKAHLKKVPKIKTHKEKTPLACYNGVYNSISFSEKVLDKWQKGIYDEQYVDYILAHEIGHAIGDKLKSHHTKRLKIHLTALLAILLSLYARVFLPNLLLQSVVLVICILGFVVWAFCIPWVIRQIYVCSELEANSNAVTYQLIDAQEMARQILRKANFGDTTLKLSPMEILEYVWNVFTHPTIAEQLQNLNLKIKEPVDVEKANNLILETSKIKLLSGEKRNSQI